MVRLGGAVISLNKESSSAMKGESLEGEGTHTSHTAHYVPSYCLPSSQFSTTALPSTDTVCMMQAYCDVLVLRHPEPGATKVTLFYNTIASSSTSHLSWYGIIRLTFSH